MLCLAAAGLASWFPAFRTAAFVLLFAAMFLIGSAFTTAGRTARALQRFRGAHVRIVAWGRPLPASDGPFYVESVSSLGVGLLVRLQVAQGATAILLKVAQPRDVLVSGERLTIGRAAYVQWASRRVKRTNASPGPALLLESVPDDPLPRSGPPAA